MCHQRIDELRTGRGRLLPIADNVECVLQVAPSKPLAVMCPAVTGRTMTSSEIAMRLRLVSVALFSCCVLTAWLAAPVAAQWLNHPTPGVPRTADGKPNLAAPAPRTPDGKPDLSGLWFTDDAVPCQASGGAAFLECGIELPISRFGINMGFGSPGGLPYRPEVATLVRTRTIENSKDDPHARCMPDTFVRAYGLPHYQRFIQTPERLVVLQEMNAMYRVVFTDGRPLPTDPNPTWNGYSVGRWDGRALVIDSIGFRDEQWLDMQGSPLSDQAKIRERITRPTYGQLLVETTVDDPKYYTRPWTVTLKQKIVLDTELIDEICVENEKSFERMQRIGAQR